MSRGKIAYDLLFPPSLMVILGLLSPVGKGYWVLVALISAINVVVVWVRARRRNRQQQTS